MYITLTLLFGMVSLTTSQQPEQDCTATIPVRDSDGSIVQASLAIRCQQDMVQELSRDLASNQEVSSFSITFGSWSIGHSGPPDQRELDTPGNARSLIAQNVSFNGRFRNAPLVMSRTVSLSVEGACAQSRESKIAITPEDFQHVIELTGPCDLRSITAEWIAFEVFPSEAAETIDSRWLRGPVEELMSQRSRSSRQ